MLIKLRRTRENDKSTIGELIAETGGVICVTLEDAFHEPKIPHSTRIPAGTYQIKLRTEGGFHQRYERRFGPDFHKGMLWIADVPGFEFILIHLGNTIDDTSGCILTGTTVSGVRGTDAFEVIGSEVAYRQFYPPVRDALLRQETVRIQISDPPRLEPLVA